MRSTGSSREPFAFSARPPRPRRMLCKHPRSVNLRSGGERPRDPSVNLAAALTRSGAF